jgi:LexA-binding, inner membrane-associated putative hydrolase
MFLTLIRIFFGVDMALGLLNYVAWSWAMGQRFNVIFLTLSILSTHLPDWDMIPFLMLRKRYRLYSHWIVGHHPVFVISAVVLGTFYAVKAWAPDAVAYTVGMITCGVVVHFCHDTMSPIGFPWLSPFTQAHFRFQKGKSIVVSQAELDASEKQERALCRTAASEITGRAEPISLGMFLFWGIGALALIVFVISQPLSTHR